MKKMIVRALALILAMVLVGSLCLTAFATETTGNSFNAGLSISTDSTTGVITVTVSDDAGTQAILQAQKPTLAVVCSYADVVVSDGTNSLPFVIADGKVSFTVADTGSYTITPNYVVAIDGTNYFSLEEAFAAAAAGSTVTLLKDLTLAAGTAVTIPGGVTLEVPTGMVLTVDGKLTVSGALVNNGTLSGQANIFCMAHTDSDTDGSCDICGFYAGGALVGNTLTLNGDIVQNYYTTLADPEGVTMVFTLPSGGTRTVHPVASGNYYVFSLGVAAKEMSDSVTGTLMGPGGVPGQSYTFSNRAYADVILSSTDNDTYIAAQPMVRAMLHYGAYAQKHFGYNTDNLANAGLGDPGIDAITYSTLSNWSKPVTQNLATVRFVGASMILESNTTLRLFFRLNTDVSNVVFRQGDTVLTPTLRGNNYYVDIPNICASNLDTDYTVTFTVGEEAGSVTYNPMTYCYTILKSSAYADSLKELVKTIYLYNQAANALFESAN